MKQIFVFLSLVFISCGEANSVKTLQGNALGTTYSIKYFADDFEVHPREIDSLLDIINTSMSTYIKDSDISKINSGDSTVVVDKHFKTVFKASKLIYKNTGGYFDPSVGLLVNAYGFGPEGYSEGVSQKDIDFLHQFVGFDKVELTSSSTLKSTSNLIYIDFNAIAKGYTVDLFCEFLKSKGTENYLVEIGGEVKVEGINLQSSRPWKVGIELPLENESREIKYGLNLYDESLATSGNYRKYRVDSDTGKKYVHTIDPNTGKSQKSDILSASVITKSCADADAYATAFIAMGIEKAKIYLEKTKHLKVVFIYSDETGNQKSFISEELQDSIEEF